MSLVNVNASSLVSSLGIAPGQGLDNTSPAAGDASFKALLAIGIEDANVPDDVSHDQEQSSAREEKERDKEKNAPSRAASDITVPASHIALPVTQDISVATVTEKPSAPQANDEPVTPAGGVGGKEQAAPVQPADKNQAKTDKAEQSQEDAPIAPAAAANTGDTDSAEPDTAENQLRAGLAAQLGGIGKILESMAQLLAGAVAVTVTADAVAAPKTQNTIALVAVQNTGAGAADAVKGQVADGTTIALIKDIQSIIQSLQNALMGSQEGTGEAQDTAGTQIGAQQKITTLVDALNRDLAKLLPLLSAQEGATDGIPQFDALKLQLRDSIAQVRSQLQQLSQDNENLYARALNRFQAQLGMTQNVTADTAASDAASPEKPASPLSTLAIAKDNDKAPLVQASVVVSVSEKPVAANAAVVVPASQLLQDNGTGSGTNNPGGNNAGGNGGQTAPQALAGLAAAGTGQASSASGDSAFARALSLTGQRPLAEQVSLHIKTAIADGSSKIHIQLDPEDLGKLDIKLNVRADGKTGITITADNSNTLNILQRDVQNLLRALSDAGLQADSGSLSFNLRGEQQGQQDNQQMAMNYQKAQPEENDETVIQALSRSYVLNLDDGLDITI